MASVLFFEPRARLGEVLAERLRASPAVAACALAAGPEGEAGIAYDTVVYQPPASGRRTAVPDLAHARRVLSACAARRVRQVVLLSSTAVYAAHWHNPGLLAEDRLASRHQQHPIARRWQELEGLAGEVLGGVRGVALTILRAATMPVRDDPGPLGGLFHGWVAGTVLGHDPSIQLLSPEDLAGAVCRAVEAGRGGVFNVVPSGVIPLRQAVRLAGAVRLPVLASVQYAARAGLSRLRLAYPGARTDYLRYNWTASGEKIRRELGFVPARSSADALCDCRRLETGSPPRRWREYVGRTFDDFGFDPDYYARVGRTLARFLERYYWRVETKGFEHIPVEGPAVLVGVHRGYMPLDGVIFTHQVARTAGRVPRFLIHPALVKFPVLHDFMTKQCGVIACNENADYALRRGELLALFPEGIRGAFRLYRDAYTLGKFGRDEYVRMALRNRAPIVPFVTVGPAEALPILGKIECAWWKRYAEWPFIPVTPTFPLPLPLPSKWHTLVLEPVHVERDYPPEAAGDDQVVGSVGRLVRVRLEQAMRWMCERRPSIFFGSVFRDGEAPPVGEFEQPARGRAAGLVPGR